MGSLEEEEVGPGFCRIRQATVKPNYAEAIPHVDGALQMDGKTVQFRFQ